ncbi:MAG TPA: TonB-dependent receptor [Sphingomonadaceae bacterium]|nr:TonB-dependent receptor [Sphingomonadaceae bacterium]
MFSLPFRACALVASALPVAAHAADAAADVANAEPGVILVVGQRNAPISIEPRGLSVSLGQRQFDAVNAANVEDLMKYAPDFFVRSRYIGDNNGVPGFRGTHSTQSARALVMVDGFVVSNFLGNSFSFPPAWGIVSPSEVKQFDIVYGPYSARYTGNSMGGIVNITTRAPERTGVFGTVQAFAQPYDQYGSHDTYFGWSAEGGFALKQDNGPFSARVSVRRLRNDGQPMQFYQLGFNGAAYGDPAAGVPVTGAINDPGAIPVSGQPGVRAPVVGDYSPVATRQDQVRAQLRFDSGDVHVEGLFTYWWNTEKTLHPATYLVDAAGAPFYGSAANGGLVSVDGHSWRLDAGSVFNLGIARRNQWLGGLRVAAPLAGFDWRLNLSMLRFDRQDALRSNGYANGVADGPGQITSQGPTGWYTADLLATRTLGAHSIAFGLNANQYHTDQSVFATTDWRAATGRTLRTRTFGKTRLIGLFAEDEVALGGGVTVTAGIRGEFWRAYAGGLTALVQGAPVTQRYDQRHASAWSPKLALRGEIAPGWAAELSLATATRFPTVGELFQGSLDGNGAFNPNSFDPNLRPERSHDANLLVRHPIGPVVLTGSLFYQRVKNAIFSYIGFNQNNVSTSSFKNIDVTRQYGAELIAESRDWPIAGLDIEANAAWIDAETVRNSGDPASEGVQFPRIPRWRLGGNIRYQLTPTVQTVFGARYATRPNTDLDGLYRGDTYGYTSELLALDARVNWRPREGLRLSAGVNNLTNDRAWVFHPYPQRTFFLEAGYSL